MLYYSHGLRLEENRLSCFLTFSRAQFLSVPDYLIAHLCDDQGKDYGKLRMSRIRTSGFYLSKRESEYRSDTDSDHLMSNLLPGEYFLRLTSSEDSAGKNVLSRSTLVVAQRDTLVNSQRTVGVIGSCVTMGNFNSALVPDWRSRFNLTDKHYQMSFISLFSPPIDIDIDMISDLDQHSQQCTIMDFNKRSLERFKSNPPEAMIVDLRSDIRFPIIETGSSFVTDNSWKLGNSTFYECFNGMKRISYSKNKDQYVDLFIAALGEFNIFRKRYLPNTRVFLNSARSVKSYSFDGNVVDLPAVVGLDLNDSWEALEKIFLANVDATVIDAWTFDTESDAGHPWGVGPVHFQSIYYKRFSMKLREEFGDERRMYLTSESSTRV